MQTYFNLLESRGIDTSEIYDISARWETFNHQDGIQTQYLVITVFFDEDRNDWTVEEFHN